MPRLTADLVLQAPNFINPVKDRQLDLRGKMISAIENLGATQDQFDTIDFSDNEIEKLENFPLLPRLQCIYLINNHISKISAGLSDSLPKLDTLILTNNRLVNLHDIDPLAEVTTLHTLSLMDNVITKKPHYRLYVIHKLPSLRLLDFKKIKAKERAESVKMFGQPASIGKKKKGKLQKQREEQAKTFTPGVPEVAAVPKKVVTETPADQLAVKVAIENAKTMEEIQRVERMIKSGKSTEDTTMTDT
jgi:U2 small nuclear ribonucleoprotein A'